MLMMIMMIVNLLEWQQQKLLSAHHLDCNCATTTTFVKTSPPESSGEQTCAISCVTPYMRACLQSS